MSRRQPGDLVGYVYLSADPDENEHDWEGDFFLTREAAEREADRFHATSDLVVAEVRVVGADPPA